MIFHENHLLADYSHENIIQYFFINKEKCCKGVLTRYGKLTWGSAHARNVILVRDMFHVYLNKFEFHFLRLHIIKTNKF